MNLSAKSKEADQLSANRNMKVEDEIKKWIEDV